MCGVNGIILPNDCHDEVIRGIAAGNKLQLHRGPDAQGEWTGNVGEWNIGMGHQRLSVLDLSAGANQPMLSEDGRQILIYNGEVYNYRELREELRVLGCHFTNDSDTQVVLAALHHWGAEKALNRFNGMWAFAWLNIEEQRMYLARDRYGVKPLYFYIENEQFYFASEIKTILETVPRKFSLDLQVVGEFLLQSLAESSTDTFIKEIKRLPAGSYMAIDLKDKKLYPQTKIYYQLPANSSAIYSHEKSLIQQVRELFFEAVKVRMRSDVPLGILLSGGVDSSSIATVVKILKEDASELNLLSAVSSDKRFDESPFIDTMARYLQTPVHKVNLELRPDNAFRLLQQTCWFNDEPVGSFSNVAHYLLMQKAKEHGITVILSGQGADEILCGYRKYLGFYLQELLRTGKINKAVQLAGGFLLNRTVVNQFSMAEAQRYLPGWLQSPVPDIRGAALQNYQAVFVGLSPGMDVRQRQILDVTRFSVPVLTHTEDRMSMAWSREIRVPFLDYRLAELLINLPVELKLRKGWTKYIFRKAMEPYLPASIAWRKDKQGFVNPQSEWLKHELKDEVLNYFAPDSRIFKYGLIRRNGLLKLYEIYCRQKPGKGSVWFKNIFNSLALEIWLRQYERYLS